MNFLYPFTTMTFSYPLALTFPFIYYVLRYTFKAKKQSISHPKVSILSKIGPSLRIRLRRFILELLMFISLIALTFAAARPQKISVQALTQQSRNILLSLDVSKSMGGEDFQSDNGTLSRLEGVQMVSKEFINARSNDRIGLVVFGQNAFVQAPLTLDHEILSKLIDNMEVGMAGDGTAIGDGIGVALKRIAELDAPSKAIILVTDGANNSGQVNPIQAAKIAKDLNVKIHTIGIGSNKPINITVPRGFFSQRIVQQVEFDEKTLKEIAEITGGIYFNAANLSDLKKVYDEIDKLEKTESKEPKRQIVQELFVTYAIIGLIGLTIYLLLARTIFMKVP